VSASWSEDDSEESDNASKNSGSHLQMYIHTRTSIHTCACKMQDGYTAEPHIHTHTRILARAHAHAHAHTRAHTHIHTHTHTHTGVGYVARTRQQTAAGRLPDEFRQAFSCSTTPNTDHKFSKVEFTTCKSTAGNADQKFSKIL